MMRPGQRVGGYEILDCLGRGGMGVVYLARPSARSWRELLGGIGEIELVALKTVTGGHFDEEGVRRFANEHKVLGLLDHPNIVQALGPMEEDQGLHFFAMELVDGCSLGHRLKEEGRLPAPTAVRIACEILEALEASHERGVVHRDIKPTNVLLGLDGAVKVADFGLAHVIDWTRLTLSSGVLGTPSYMAPEQIDAASVDPRGDLYSVTAVLYEMLTGYPPFEGEGPLAVLRQHLEAPSPTLSQRGGIHLRRFDALIARGLAKDPADRFDDARTFRAALETVCPEASEVEHAELAAPGAEEPTRKVRGMAAARRLRGRRRWRALGILVILLLMAGGGTYLAFQRSEPPAASGPVSSPEEPEASPEPRGADPTETPSRPLAEIRLHDGQRIEGYVLRREQGTMVVQTPDGEEKKIPLEDVAEVRFGPDGSD